MNIFTVSTLLLMYVVEAQLILNGSTGRLLALQPALLPRDNSYRVNTNESSSASTANDNYNGLVAFTTLHKVGTHYKERSTA